MAYFVKEIFQTLQGEGAHAGRAAVFCRFSGCNLWTGRESDRASAVCRFCDTDFVGTDGEGGGKFDSAAELALAIAQTWRGGEDHRYVVCTGGEPALQLDRALVCALHDLRFQVAIETNGTRALPEGIDWICVSPKAGTELVVTSGGEVKVVFPQLGLDLSPFAEMEFAHRFVQPMDGPNLKANTELAVAYCQEHPAWRLSVQTHKYLGIA
ncbi:MAG: 7-carboxy-7-deazaguanine synthase [Polyangiaceae bacterium]